MVNWLNTMMLLVHLVACGEATASYDSSQVGHVWSTHVATASILSSPSYTLNPVWRILFLGVSSELNLLAELTLLAGIQSLSHTKSADIAQCHLLAVSAHLSSS